MSALEVCTASTTRKSASGASSSPSPRIATYSPEAALSAASSASPVVGSAAPGSIARIRVTSAGSLGSMSCTRARAPRWYTHSSHSGYTWRASEAIPSRSQISSTSPTGSRRLIVGRTSNAACWTAIAASSASPVSWLRRQMS